MLTLAILRHAKSSWDDPAEDDFDRPLNARGKKAAPEAGAAIEALGLSPQAILCSPSRRTRETLELALPKMGFAVRPKISFEERLYLATAADLMECIGEVAGNCGTLLVIGHNPGLHSLAVSLAGSGDAKTLARLSEKYPTAALAVIRFDRESWRHARPGTGALQAFWTPREGLGSRD